MSEFFRIGETLGVPWFRLYLADSLAARYASADGTISDEHATLMRWLLLHLAVQAGTGHMRTDLHALEAESAEWLASADESGVPGLNADLPARLAAAAETLVESGLSVGFIGRLTNGEASADSLAVPRPPLCLTADGRYLYFLKRRRTEDRLLALLGAQASLGDPDRFPAPPILPDTPVGILMSRLTEGRRLLILSGGPGTGKTTTVAALLALLSDARKAAGMRPARIIPAAPTGRAAARLSESLIETVPGRTLHSLLGLVPGRPPKHHRDHPLDAHLVVVDEASMVDVPMMNLLLDAMPPTATLLLVGDPDQLPSVEAGALLGDLLAGRRADTDASGPLAGAVLELTDVYRSSTAILDAAAAVREGNAESLAAACRPREGDDDGFLGVRMRPLSRLETVTRELAAGFESAVGTAQAAAEASPALFAAYAAQAVLTPLRRGPWGVPSLNERISNLLGGSSAPFAGMPIMVTGNDASRNLWNGDRGIVLSRNGRLRAAFPEGEGARELPLAALPGWEAAWAQTIHKSQGSEFDAVVILLPRGAERLFSREILYTALTRAKTRAVLLYEEGAVEAALTRGVHRNSRVREWASGGA